MSICINKTFWFKYFIFSHEDKLVHSKADEGNPSIWQTLAFSFSFEMYGRSAGNHDDRAMTASSFIVNFHEERWSVFVLVDQILTLSFITFQKKWSKKLASIVFIISFFCVCLCQDSLVLICFQCGIPTENHMGVLKSTRFVRMLCRVEVKSCKYSSIMGFFR